ncbi:ABC transporter permease [Mucilaginibacter ginsenosidivorax]|uniref:FtsX-like permease family protein n=1 Tax=Mucilaginibacter ginsenosidivorax TaxID=862126 RepID=A0A5B8VS49_9SPHI|nr:ABC transporter permease [Mucilaginibacter ginsenosidivorax]QEC74464.1 FtsX-like permease family protein [Mucilaginibacter ginsenosidivorax]
MIKNYLKIAWRNLIRNKGFSLTNILGLTIGMTCSIFIFLWVKDEVSFDKFHTSHDDIYKLMANRDFKNSIFTDENMAFPLAKALETGNPQIKYAVMTSHQETHMAQYGNVKLNKTGYQVSDQFFKMFSWKFIRGDAKTPINDPRSIVITQSAAKAFFGNDDPINKVIKIDNQLNFKVSAVIADPPGNSTFQFDFIAPFEYSSADSKARMHEWTNSSNFVFIQATPGANPQALDKYVNDVKHKNDTHDAISTYYTFAMNRWHLYGEFKDGKNIGGMIEYVKMFTVIAIIILLIACVNFMNLSTARSEKRAKEVGIRKTLGSDKKQLIIQFFFESIILTCIAFVFAIACVYLLMPLFNTLVSKNLHLAIFDRFFLTGMVTIILFTGIVAGSYPALYLSSFNPVKVLKGTFAAGKSAVLPRRILVIGQFVMSILLISATIIVYQQIQHIKGRGIGYNPNNLVMIPSSQAVDKNYVAIKQELFNTNLISAVTRTSAPITEVWWKSGSPDYDGKPAGAIIFSGLSTDVDFTKTMGTKVLMGRDFNATPGDSAVMLLNKAAVDAMNLKSPIGMVMRYGPRKYTVAGVIENIVMESPYKPVEPLMVYYSPNGSNRVTVRLKDGVKPQAGIQALQTIFKKYNPENIFEYQFVDQEFGKKFITEELISRITNIFAGLAIFICCIGLAGLASFTIEKRFREIGVRKVLGASVQQLLMLISTEFLKLVLVAFVIAVPLSWWLMSDWLQKYTYHINISIWLFAAVGIIILALTLVVVSLNTLKAALANPVKSLRSE